MKNLTNAFGSLYHPQKALLIYQQAIDSKQVYIESYDIDPQGRPINAHPLSVTEGAALAKALHTNDSKNTAFLKPAGLLPKNLLYLNTEINGYAVWHTPKQNRKLLFRGGLGIKNGYANIPALLWKATKDGLAIYALADDKVIDLDTELHHAPFFNTYNDGKVCMGNVAISISKNCGLEDFITQWEEAFFNSYFSHMMQGHNPVKGNMVQLWQSLVGTKKQFPLKALIPNKKTLKHLIR
ncbi:PRTRC system protein B [Mucilaginibacter glaciei]|uniref:PRTRC system protein B n=1 Tax=Mucilaginibacter glaciei TaxID=2772109 RepID=A0A926NTR2_9SPHI|nr:PRTRC system protein B [Mucilaginibacter glaciei]MBD1395118.1 PRTRC system protein B [Mucilaginibacter glaciei]